MKGFCYLRGVVTLEYFPERCVGCGMCVSVCPHGVFVLEGPKAEVASRDACMECGACALNCPTDAIGVDSGVGCASGLLTEWWRATFPGRKGDPPAGCC